MYTSTFILLKEKYILAGFYYESYTLHIQKINLMSEIEGALHLNKRVRNIPPLPFRIYFAKFSCCWLAAVLLYFNSQIISLLSVKIFLLYISQQKIKVG
jgi:hypothetical protein